MPLLLGHVELQPRTPSNPTRGLAPDALPTRPCPPLIALWAASHLLHLTPAQPRASTAAASLELTTTLVAKPGVYLVPVFRV